MDALWQDLRYGWRRLRSQPAFTLVAVATLALGIGANSAIFSAVNALLLRPLPVEDVNHLVFGMALRERFDPFGTSLLEYALYRGEARSLSSSGLGAPRQFSLLGKEGPQRLKGSAVTASYLTTLGVKPLLGRLFLLEEDRPGGPAVALLGHDLWQKRFGADRGVVGRELDLEGRAHTIVGVLPPGFDLPYSAEIWVPMQVDIGLLPLDRRAANSNEFIGRLKPEVSLEEADAELKGLARRLESDYPQIRRGWSFGIVPLRRLLLADLEGRSQRSLLSLVVAVGFLLLICCANVAGLLLARGIARQGEIAVRLGLGASRPRIVRQLLTESLLLALLGGATGVLLALWLQPILEALNPIQAVGLGRYLGDFRIDARVLSFSLVVTILTGVAFGLAPAVLTAGAGFMPFLKRREQRGGGGIAGRRSLGALVIAEIAVAATLLVGGGLMLRSFQRLQGIDLGFRPERLLTMELPLSETKYPDQTRQVRFMNEVLERVRAIPGVVAAGMSTNVPLQRGVVLDSVFEVEGRPRANPSDVPVTSHRLVSPGYIETLGVALLKGRSLDERDRAGALPVVVVNEELVRQAWPGEDPIGKRIRRVRTGERGPWMTVVGVVRNLKEDRFWFRIDRPVWFLPYAQSTFALPVSLPLNLVVRTAGEPADVAAAIRAAVRAVDPHQPLENLIPMMEALGDVLITERFSAVLMGALASLGLLLAALGLYGVVAYSVGRRTGEIGLRMALGARPRDVLRLVVGQVAGLVALGLAIGAMGAWSLARMLAGMLYQVSPADPATFIAVGLLLAAVAVLACWLPARRATRVSPMVTLRCE